MYKVTIELEGEAQSRIFDVDNPDEAVSQSRAMMRKIFVDGYDEMDSTLSKEEYIKRLDEECLDMLHRVIKIEKVNNGQH